MTIGTGPAITFALSPVSRKSHFRVFLIPPTCSSTATETIWGVFGPHEGLESFGGGKNNLQCSRREPVVLRRGKYGRFSQSFRTFGNLIVTRWVFGC